MPCSNKKKTKTQNLPGWGSSKNRVLRTLSPTTQCLPWF